MARLFSLLFLFLLFCGLTGCGGRRKLRQPPRDNTKHRITARLEWQQNIAASPISLGSYPNGTDLRASNSEKYWISYFKIVKKEKRVLRDPWLLLQLGDIGPATRVQVLLNRQYVGEIVSPGRPIRLLVPSSLLNQGWNLVSMREIDPPQPAWVDADNNVQTYAQTNYFPEDTIQITAFRQLGNRVKRVEPFNGGATVVYTSGRELQVSFPKACSAVRLQVDGGSSESLFEKTVLNDTTTYDTATVYRRANKWVVDAGDRWLLVNPQTQQFNVYYRDTLVRQDLGLLMANQTMLFTWPILPDEHLYGLGENTSNGSGSLSKKYTTDQIWVDNDPVKGGKPIPFMISDKGMGLSLNSSYASSYDLGAELPGRGAFFLDDYRWDSFLYLTADARRQIMEYTRFTGRPTLPPKWAFGYLSAYDGEGTRPNVALFEQLVDDHARFGWPLAAVGLGSFWQQPASGGWQWQQPHFTQNGSLIGKLRGNGLRLGLWSSPFVNQNSALQAEASRARVILRSKNGNDGKVPNPQGQPAALLDFGNPATGPWLTQLMRPRLAEASMLSLDGGAGAETHYYLKSQVGDMDEIHNLYPVLYAQAVTRALRQSPDSLRRLVFIRSGYSGIQRYPVAWGGPHRADFEGGKTLIKAGQQNGLAGIAFWAPDMGGSLGNPSEQYYIRSMQWGFFAPISRANGPTLSPWAKSDRASQLLRPYALWRHRMLPTLYSYAWHSTQTGLPMMQPVWLRFPNDSNCHRMTYQYMLGPDLLVAPFVDSAANPDSLTDRDLLLPKGMWWDYWDRRILPGGRYKLRYALGRLPVFVRGGAIFVMNDSTQRVINRPKKMTITIWPGGSGELTYYEDDGESNAYQRGQYMTLKLKYEESPGRYRLTVSRVSGVLPPDLRIRNVTVRLENTPGIKKVEVKNLPGNLPHTRQINGSTEVLLPLFDLMLENGVEFQTVGR